MVMAKFKDGTEPVQLALKHWIVNGDENKVTSGKWFNGSQIPLQ